MSAARCPSCGGSELTPTAMFSPDEGSARLNWRDTRTGKLFNVVVHRARACLTCGHVALALDDSQLAKVKAAVATLGPF